MFCELCVLCIDKKNMLLKCLKSCSFPALLMKFFSLFHLTLTSPLLSFLTYSLSFSSFFVFIGSLSSFYTSSPSFLSALPAKLIFNVQLLLCRVLLVFLASKVILGLKVKR